MQPSNDHNTPFYDLNTETNALSKNKTNIFSTQKSLYSL